MILLSIYNYNAEISIDELEMLMGAIELKLNDHDEKQSECFRKFRRHISLAVTQKYYIKKVASEVFIVAEQAKQVGNQAQEMANQAQEMANQAQNILGRINDTAKTAENVAKIAKTSADAAKKMASDANEQIKEAKKTSESMITNFVTILGIFATIIITVFGGISLSNASVKLVTSEFDLPVLVFVLSILLIAFISILSVLISWVASINNKGKNYSKLRWRILGLFALTAVASGFYIHNHIKVNNSCQIGYYTCLNMEELRTP